MVNSNLVPERRVNKNGVSSVKWVRPASSGTSKNTLPAPSKMPDSWAPRMLKEFKISRLSNGRNSLTDFIDPRVVRELEQMIADIPSEFQNEIGFQITDVLDAIADNPNVPSIVTDLSNMTVLGRAVMCHESKRRDLDGLIEGVKNVLGDRDYREAAPFTQNLAIAFVTVAARLEDEYVETTAFGAVNIYSRELRTLIHRRPQDAEDIARIVNERGSDDARMVKAALDHGEQSLRGGLL